MSKENFPLPAAPQANAGMSVCSRDDLHVGLLMARPGPAGTIDPSDRLSVMRDMEERVEFGAHHEASHPTRLCPVPGE